MYPGRARVLCLRGSGVQCLRRAGSKRQSGLLHAMRGDDEKSIKRIAKVKEEYKNKKREETSWKVSDFSPEKLKCKKVPARLGIVTWNVNHLSLAGLNLTQLEMLGMKPDDRFVMGFTSEDLEEEGITKKGSEKFRDIGEDPPEGKERKREKLKLNKEQRDAVTRIRGNSPRSTSCSVIRWSIWWRCRRST